MSRQRLTDLIESSAFTIMDPEVEGAVAFVSGDYVTLGWVYTGHYQRQYDRWVELDDTGPWPHGLGRDGLYGADAAAVYDKAREMLRNWVSEGGEEE